jgi:PP-loop superfamily ATP-utilizing enzyme
MKYRNSPRLLKKKVTEKFQALGFQTILLDPKGYRMGSLNETLEKKREHD